MQRIIYKEDGGVSVVIPVLKSKKQNESEKQWLKRVFDKATPEGASYKDTNEVLPNRRFRNAWQKGKANAVDVDLSKAKAQVLVEIREVRNKELVNTDGLMARATEIGTQKEIDDLKIQRQRLRDLPTAININTIITVEELELKFSKQLTIDKYLSM